MEKNNFFFRTEGLLKKINLDEIVCLQADNNYVKFWAPHHYYMVRTTLEFALQYLPANRFVQIHRSYAVQLDHIDTIGKDSVTLSSAPDLELPLSKKFMELIAERVRIFEPFQLGCDDKCDTYDEGDSMIQNSDD